MGVDMGMDDLVLLAVVESQIKVQVQWPLEEMEGVYEVRVLSPDQVAANAKGLSYPP